MRRPGRKRGEGAPNRARRALMAATAGALGAIGFLALLPSAGADIRLRSDLTQDSSIRARQNNVVTGNHDGPLSLARLEVSDFSLDVQSDTSALTADSQTEATAEAAFATASARLEGEQSALAADTAALAGADGQLAADRSQLGAIAVGMYTGALTDPQPASLKQLEAEQDRTIDADEVEVVAGVVDGHVHADVATAASDSAHRNHAAALVAADQQVQVEARSEATRAAAHTASDLATLTSDQGKLRQAEQSLDAAEADLASALASLAGPANAPPGQLSLLGGAALTASQMVAWFDAQGYADLTSATIEDLANWYIQAGTAEGVRGDVAFAQAVLETGGFESTDAVDLNNFAGIGHCDTCASGWAFPSPQAGVLGQIQLLRIFADRGPGPAQAPPPALAVLVPGKQQSTGCCPTVESLTGVWATDPTYGQQILNLYGSMLTFALTPQ